MRILIRDAALYTFDAAHTQFSTGSLCIDNDTIVYIGDTAGMPAAFKADRVIQGKDRLVLPAFINCHTHLGMSLFRGYANDMPLWDWLSQRIWPLEDQLSGEDVYWASLLSMMEMLAGGTGTFSDMYFFMDDVARAVYESGIRGVLARGLQGNEGKPDYRLAENRELYRRWNGEGNGRIRVMVGPHAEYTCSSDYLLQCRALAEELGVGIHIHVSETERETRECLERHGKTPVAFLNDLGIFDVPATAAHCVAVNEEDMDILAGKGVHVVHNPGSNLKLASGIAPLVEMLEKGVQVCLGTDSAASNNNLNMWEEISLTALLHKAATGDAAVIPAPMALEMALGKGAGALGLADEIGSLEVGKKADIMMVNTQKPYYYPRTDFLTHLVYSGQSSDVEMTMVNGRILMEKGEFTTIDQERICFEIDRITERLFHKN